MSELRKKIIGNLIKTFPSDPTVGDIEGVFTICYDDNYVVQEYEYEFIAYDNKGNVTEKYDSLEAAKDSRFIEIYEGFHENFNRGLEGVLERLGYYYKK